MNKNTKRTFILISILVIGSFLLMNFLGTFRKEPVKKAREVEKRLVMVEDIVYGEIESEIIEFGRVISREQVDILSEVRGKIQKGDVPLKKGQRFSSGDVLVRIYDREARLSLMAKKSRFMNLVANLLADFKIDFPERYERWRKFFDSITMERSMPALPEPKSNNEKIFLASRNIFSEFYSIKVDEEVLKKYLLTAPFDGSFTDVFMEVGGVANPGAPIAKAIRTDRMEIEVPVDSSGVKWIKTGDPVKIWIDENSGREIQGKVVRISPFIDQKTHSVALFIGLNIDPSYPVYSGDYLKVVFSGIRIKNGMKIARNAVFNNNEVFLVKDGRLEKKEVNILKLDPKTVIFNGLDEGQQVVVEPLINARDGSPVEIRRQ